MAEIVIFKDEILSKYTKEIGKLKWLLNNIINSARKANAFAYQENEVEYARKFTEVRLYLNIVNIYHEFDVDLLTSKCPAPCKDTEYHVIYGIKFFDRTFEIEKANKMKFQEFATKFNNFVEDAIMDREELRISRLMKPSDTKTSFVKKGWHYCE